VDQNGWFLVGRVRGGPNFPSAPQSKAAPTGPKSIRPRPVPTPLALRWRAAPKGCQSSAQLAARPHPAPLPPAAAPQPRAPGADAPHDPPGCRAGCACVRVFVGVCVCVCGWGGVRGGRGWGLPPPPSLVRPPTSRNAAPLCSRSKLPQPSTPLTGRGTAPSAPCGPMPGRVRERSDGERSGCGWLSGKERRGPQTIFDDFTRFPRIASVCPFSRFQTHRFCALRAPCSSDSDRLVHPWRTRTHTHTHLRASQQVCRVLCQQR
jgi:hypothetical protein